MQFQKLSVVLLSGVLAAPAFAGIAAFAPTVTTSNKTRTDNRVFVGINMAFGDKTVPEVVTGFRSMRVKSSGSAAGGGVDLTFPLGNGFTFDKVRVKGLDGKRYAQGELGAGYSFVSKSALFTGGVQGPYTALGLDYVLGKGVVWNAGINTLGPYKKADTETTVSCPVGFTLSGGLCS